jgi:predicted nucleic acid-binding protein
LGIDNRIIGEYKEVLLRKKFNFEKESVEHILKEIEDDGIIISPEPLDLSLPDKDDLPFLEVAVAGNIKILITGNRKHFPKNNYRMVKIYSPAEFISEYDKLKQ